MNFLKSHYARACEILFFIGIFWASTPILYDYDIWFDIKSGEIIRKLGLIHYDVFSFTANGKEWFPYEWFFQVVAYQVQLWFGFNGIRYMIALFSMIMFLAIYLMLKKLFRLNLWLSFAVCLYLLASISEFLTARPQVFAYDFLLVNLGLIWLYVIKRKNLLFISIPITIIWANTHGSIFLDPALFFGYAVVCLLYFFVDKEKFRLKQVKTLGFYGVLTILLTVLPPLWLTQYRLLVLFYKDNHLISDFVDEWAPLSIDPTVLLYYTSNVVLTALMVLVVAWRKKSTKELLLFLPLIIFPLSGYLAYRNLVYGYIAMALALGWAFAKLKLESSRALVKWLWAIPVVVVLFIQFQILQQKWDLPVFYYPEKAANFILANHVQGHMFNEYAYGGYLLYRLYPQQQVFVDGRTDVYLDTSVIQDYLALSTEKNLPDNQYSQFLYKTIWDKYNISLVVLRTQKDTVLRKISRILNDDPNWSLVEWDDKSEIFVRHDGLNNAVIQAFGTKAATPYDQDPYRAGEMNQALNEYQRMAQTVDSAHSRNAIGFIYLHQSKFDEARSEFIQAVKLDPTFESPYMNLGELSAKDGDFKDAIGLYQKAQTLAPDRGLIYVRLGQLYLQSSNDSEKARQIWQEGLDKIPSDDPTVPQLQSLLANNQ